MSDDKRELDPRDVRLCESCGQELPDTARLEVEWLDRQQKRIRNGIATSKRTYKMSADRHGGTLPERMSTKRDRSLARMEFELDLVVRLTERVERLEPGRP